MRTLHVVLALILAACSGSSTGLASPSISARIEAETSNPSSTPPPLLNKFPTGFAPCAGKSQSIMTAAITCVTNSIETPMTNVEVIYHVQSGIPKSIQSDARKIVAHTLAHAGLFSAQYLSPKPLRLHIVLTNNSWEYCKQVANSLGDKNLSWMWDKSREDGCNSTGGGQGIGTDLVNETSAWWYDSWATSDPGHRQEFQALFATEIGHAIQNNIGQRYGETSYFLSLPQAWLGYLWPWINGFSYTVRAWGSKRAASFWENWGLKSGVATWQPSFGDPRWCPQPGTPFATSCGEYRVNARGGLNGEYPNNYHLIAQMVPYMIAHFGPSWVQEGFWPVFISEYGGSSTSFRETYDQVARRLWDGQWAELEAALDTYVSARFKEAGIRGID